MLVNFIRPIFHELKIGLVFAKVCIIVCVQRPASTSTSWSEFISTCSLGFYNKQLSSCYSNNRYRPLTESLGMQDNLA